MYNIFYFFTFQQTIEQWHKTFIICIIVVLSSGVVFSIFGSAEIQSWNDVPQDNSQEGKHKTDLRY